MNQRIDESLLLGYLLNSLDSDEQLQIEQAIAADPTVQARLEQLRHDFQGLLESAVNDIPEPPGNLASSTIQAISDGRRRRELQKPAYWSRFCNRTKLVKGLSAEDVDPRGGVGLMRSAIELSVLGVCILVFGTVILSNTHLAREQARQQSCAYNLTNFGYNIEDYAFHGPNQVAPEIEPFGPLAFAGIYSVRLNDRQLLTEVNSLWCPSSYGSNPQLQMNSIRSLPSLKDLMNAQLDELAQWRRWIGGSYAYNLGVMSHGQYRMPRYLSRPEFALMGDSPVIEHGEIKWNSHGRNRCNILYEDGRVVLQLCGPDVEMVNHPYLNEKGELKAGCNKDDSALGPSFFGPLDDFNVTRVQLDHFP